MDSFVRDSNGFYRCTLCYAGPMQSGQRRQHREGGHHQSLLQQQLRVSRSLQQQQERASRCNEVESEILNGVAVLGLPRWRHAVKSRLFDFIYYNQGTKGGIFKAFQRYLLMERLSLLELAVWKASLLLDGLTMQDLHHQWAMDERFDPAGFAREYRVVSGVAVIVPNVMAYLMA